MPAGAVLETVPSFHQAIRKTEVMVAILDRERNAVKAMGRVCRTYVREVMIQPGRAELCAKPFPSNAQGQRLLEVECLNKELGHLFAIYFTDDVHAIYICGPVSTIRGRFGDSRSPAV